MDYNVNANSEYSKMAVTFQQGRIFALQNVNSKGACFALSDEFFKQLRLKVGDAGGSIDPDGMVRSMNDRAMWQAWDKATLGLYENYFGGMHAKWGYTLLSDQWVKDQGTDVEVGGTRDLVGRVFGISVGQLGEKPNHQGVGYVTGMELQDLNRYMFVFDPNVGSYTVKLPIPIWDGGLESIKKEVTIQWEGVQCNLRGQFVENTTVLALCDIMKSKYNWD